MTDEFEIKLLKFADSELTPEEESCLLLDCELSPERWKDLALALVAERRLHDAFAGFDSFESERPVQRVQASRGSKAMLARASKGLVMSLAVVLAFLAGRHQFNPPANEGEIAQVQPSGNMLDDDEGALGQPSVPETNFESNAMNTMFADSDGGSDSVGGDEQAESLYQAVNPWTVVSKPVISDEDRGAFFDAGLDVEEQNTVYIVSDSEGGRWAIPWKAVNVRYSASQ